MASYAYQVWWGKMRQMEGSRMENNEISEHEIRVYCVLRDTEQWVTSADVVTTGHVKPRTARHHLRRLVNLGIVDMAAVFPGHRYRLAKMAGKRNAGYLRRLLAALDVVQGSKSAPKVGAR
jgi:DNA-binding transcriptional ArsR family regulator